MAVDVVNATPVVRRLRQKTSFNQKRPGKKFGVKQKGLTARDQAIQAGMVPKARTSYALFTKSEMQKDEYAGLCWPQCAKQLGSKWKSLTVEGKKSFLDQAQKETHDQQKALAALGIGVTKQAAVQANGGVTPSGVQFGSFKVIAEREVGHGTYGRVISAKENTTERRVALKIFTDEDDAKTEINLYRLMARRHGHRCILPLLNSCSLPRTPWIAMPHVVGPNLRHVLQNIDLPLITRTAMVTQLAETLTWLHGSDIVHLDVKPSNVLWDARSCNLYLIDFGMALEVQANGRPKAHVPFVGVTANYRPPELWQDRVTATTVCTPIDVWSFGCTVVEIYSGKMFMPGESASNVKAQVDTWTNTWNRRMAHWGVLAVPSHLRNVVWYSCAPSSSARAKMNSDVVSWARTLPLCPNMR